MLLLGGDGKQPLVGATSWNKAERDRDVWDRQSVLESLQAWRFNPLARQS